MSAAAVLAINRVGVQRVVRLCLSNRGGAGDGDDKAAQLSVVLSSSQGHGASALLAVLC